ncbi:MAG: hypothetical protein OEY14_16305, partial [Myxococcales bacterium]|nr:hypothetical protein [Myxococcales bacterium]
EAKAPPYSAAASSAMARGKAPRASASPAPRRGSGVGSWIGVAFLALLVGGGTYALLRPEAAPASGDTPARASLEAGPAAGESAAGEPAAGESAAGESAAGEPTVAPQPVIEPVIEPAIEPVIEPAIEPAIEPSAGSEPEPEPPIEPAPAPGSSTAHGLASSSSAGPLAGELPPVLAEALRRLDSSEELSEADLQPLYSYVTNHAFDARVHLVMGRSFVRMGWQRAAVEAYARAVRVGEDVHEDPLILGHLIELLSARDEFWDRSWPAIRDGWRARALPAVEEALESNTEWGAQRRLRRLHSRLSRFDSDEG